MGVYRRISVSDRPEWADIASAGVFRIEPESDVPSRYDEDGVRYVVGRFDPHYHDGDEYWLICQGRGVVRIEDEEYPFGPGDIVCIERGHLHDVVGVYETVEAFWFEGPVPSRSSAGHLHRTPEDAIGHVVPLLRDAPTGSDAE